MCYVFIYHIMYGFKKRGQIKNCRADFFNFFFEAEQQSIKSNRKSENFLIELDLV